MSPKEGWSLRFLLSSQFLLVAIIPLVVVSLLSLIFLLPKIQKTHSQDQKAIANSISGQVKTYLDNAATDLRVLASFSVQTDFSDKNIGDLLDLYATNQSYFEAIYLTDKQGKIKQIGLPDYHHHLRQNFIDIDLSHSQLYKQSNSSGRWSWSETFLSTISGRLSIAYTQPLLNGTLIGEISVDELPKLVFRLADQYGLTVMILDQQRQLVAHPNYEYSLQQLNFSHQELVQRTDAGERVTLPMKFQDDDLIGTAALMPDLNWMVIAAQDRLLVEGERSAINQILLAAVLIGFVASGVIATLLSRAFTKGFSQNTEQARKLAQGDYDITPTPSRIKEINWLGESLKKTGSAIETREKELVARQNRFRALVEQSPLAIIEWNTDFSINNSNQLASDLLGLEESTKCNNAIRILKKLVQSHLITAGTLTEEFTISDSTRHYIFLSYNTTIRSDNGEVISYLSLVQDITLQRETEAEIRNLNAELEMRVEERTKDLHQTNTELHQAMNELKRTQDELIQSEKLAALGSLVAGVSHELNTPIGNSLMASSTLFESSRHVMSLAKNNQLTKTDFDNYIAEMESGNEILMSNLKRASELIKSFKQIAVDQASSQHREFDLKQLLHEILRTLQPMLKKTPYKVTLNIPGGIVLESFPGALAQIITNLVQNATVHAFDGEEDGLIEIYVEETSHDEIVIQVEDNGKGIAKDKQSNIFDPFFTTKLGQGGSGLGLHIVHNLVTSVLQGSVNVQSDVGQGTCITVQIPRTVEPSGSETH